MVRTAAVWLDHMPLEIVEVLSCYDNFNTCCMIIDVWYVKISTCCSTIHLCYTLISMTVLTGLGLAFILDIIFGIYRAFHPSCGIEFSQAIAEISRQKDT